MSVTCLCQPGDIVTIHHQVSANQRAPCLLLTNQSDHTSPTCDVSPRRFLSRWHQAMGDKTQTDGPAGKLREASSAWWRQQISVRTGHLVLWPKLTEVKVNTNYFLMPETEDGYLSCKKSSGNSLIVILFFRKPQLFCYIFVAKLLSTEWSLSCSGSAPLSSWSGSLCWCYLWQYFFCLLETWDIRIQNSFSSNHLPSQQNSL